MTHDKECQVCGEAIEDWRPSRRLGTLGRHCGVLWLWLGFGHEPRPLRLSSEAVLRKALRGGDARTQKLRRFSGVSRLLRGTVRGTDTDE